MRKKLCIMLSMALLCSLVFAMTVFAAEEGGETDVENGIQPYANSTTQSYTDGKGYVYGVTGVVTRTGKYAYVGTTYQLKDWFIPTQADKDAAANDIKGILANADVGALNLASDKMENFLYVRGATYTLQQSK